MAGDFHKQKHMPWSKKKTRFFPERFGRSYHLETEVTLVTQHGYLVSIGDRSKDKFYLLGGHTLTSRGH